MNCKPGDIAVIIKCPEHPSNVGLIVEVIEPVEFFAQVIGAVWVVLSLGSHMRGTFFFDPVETTGHRANCPDEYLRPILPLTEAVEDLRIEDIAA